MTENVIPFNPLDKKNLGASVAEALLVSSVHPLDGLQSFYGAGIYVIYYTGDFAEYEPIASRNRDGKFLAPIYIGKAIPEGGRKGIAVATRTTALYRRLKDHAESIRAAAPGLRIEDFHCRHLVVDDIWIPLGESLLITRYEPLWNRFIDGFGNHDPGAGRHQGMRPRWDVLHPGRAWAARCRPRPESKEDIRRDIRSRLQTATFTTSTRFISPDGD